MIPNSVLALDSGSSSLKFALYHARERVGRAELDPVVDGNVSAAQNVWDKLARIGIEPKAIGHRLVFGGVHDAPARVAPTLLEELDSYVVSFPLHLRPQLDLVEAATRRFANVPQVVCFDTAFFHRMPSIAKMLPLPRRLTSGMQRHGFHGLSIEYIASTVDVSQGRTVIAHLGSGASLCALKDGLPIDSTMGSSVLGGLMMATRPGDLDPGVLLALLRDGEHTTEILEELLYQRSGLLGVSNLSGDMHVLLEAAKTDTAAREAIDLFVYQLVKHLGAMVAVLGGLDRLIFTGGIGEHAAGIRVAMCRRFAYLGIELDPAANSRNDAVISKSGSRIPVQVIRTDENRVIARHTVALLGL